MDLVCSDYNVEPRLAILSHVDHGPGIMLSHVNDRPVHEQGLDFSRCHQFFDIHWPLGNAVVILDV